MSDQYIIKDEIRLLIQKRKPNQYKKLYKEIVHQKQYPTITVWNDLIAEGIEEYEICEINGLPYRIHHIEVSSVLHLYSWICARQIERRNITTTMRRFLIGYQAMVETSIENGLNHIDELAKGYAIGKLAVLYSYNRQRISCYKAMASSITKIYKKNPVLASRILDEQLVLSLNAINNLALKSDQELERLNTLIDVKDQKQKINYKDLWEELGWDKAKRISLKSMTVPPMDIKKMPEYDPDLPLLSLSLTIGSWINSIERIGSENLSEVSKKTKQNLSDELDQLIESAFLLKQNLKGENNHE